MSPDAKDVIVIGAGMGGMATAARLAKKGYTVRVLRREIAMAVNVGLSGLMGTHLIQVHHY